jgi:transcriptional regulator with XRE-family HTH domain
MHITRLGRFMRMLRLEYSQNQKQMAGSLGYTQAYVSCVESGKKVIPQEFKKRILKSYALNAEQIQALDDIIEHSQPQVTIYTNDDELNIRLLNLLKDRLNKLTDGQKNEVLKIVAS